MLTMRPQPRSRRLRQHRLHGVEGGRQVDGDDRVPALGGKGLDGAGVLDAGVVDHDVDRRQRLCCCCDQPRGLVGAGQVGANVGAACGQLRCDPRAFGGAFDAVHHHLRAGLGQRLGDGQADALGRSGDECGAALQHGRILRLE
jgi:hypothetical protein